MEKLVIAGREFNSRLFLGTGKFHSDEVMEQSILASGTEMVTVAMKRIELDNKEDDMLVHIQHPGIQLLPNTSGVRRLWSCLSFQDVRRRHAASLPVPHGRQ